MRLNSQYILFFLIALCSIGSVAQARGTVETKPTPEERQVWQGKFADGTTLTWKRLQELLSSHKQWVKTADRRIQEKIKRAEEAPTEEEIGLILQRLIETDWVGGENEDRLVLEGADLQSAPLEGAELWYANLKGADLRHAKLQEAKLQGANLDGAKLTGACLENAALGDAYLKRAKLFFANLKGASLQNANLEGAELAGSANLEGADLLGANLEGVNYEAKIGRLPDIVRLAYAYNLEKMRFKSLPYAMDELRQAFKKVGLRQQEREITYAIKHSERLNWWRDGKYIRSLFSLVFFEWPVQYGFNPGRALIALISAILVFSIAYLAILINPSRRHAIWRILPRERIEMTEDRAILAEDAQIECLKPKSWRVITYALYFSLLSAFHIGWRELNVGNWISRIQPSSYTLQATGWVRTVSGVQSLISVYLLAMWALTYFGRPFE